MNNIFRYIVPIFLAVLLTAQGCQKQLDLQSDGRITMDQVFSDYNRTRGYLNSCYGYVPIPHMNRSSYTDEAWDADDVTAGSPYAIWYAGNVTAMNYASASVDGIPWGNLYEGIRKCNVFLEGMGTATVVAPDDEKASWIAQAHALRALYYLQLVKRYGDVPIFDKPLPIGHDFSQDRKASFSEVVGFIVQDCRAALEVPDGRPGFSWNIYDNQFGVMTRAVVYAILSQAITYAVSPLWADGGYTQEDAVRITGEALNACLMNDYRLFDLQPEPDFAQNAYALYFLTNSNDQRAVDKETIYRWGGEMEVWRNAGMPSTEGMDRTGPCPTQEMVDSYEMANGEPPVLGYQDDAHLQPILNPASGYDPQRPYEGRDPRFYASIYFDEALRHLDQPDGNRVESRVGGREGISSTNRRSTRTGYYLRKYNNHRSGLNNNADGFTRIFRLAELYLNFAEAAYQFYGPDAQVDIGSGSLSAREAVNRVRARAGMPGLPAGLSKEAFEARYRNERKIEFAFEEHRFFDVRRWNILSQTDEKLTGMRIQNEDGSLTYQRFSLPSRNSASTRFLRYPLDQTEVNKIFELTGQDWQNPGWLD